MSIFEIYTCKITFLKLCSSTLKKKFELSSTSAIADFSKINARFRGFKNVDLEKRYTRVKTTFFETLHFYIQEKFEPSRFLVSFFRTTAILVFSKINTRFGGFENGDLESKGYTCENHFFGTLYFYIEEKFEPSRFLVSFFWDHCGRRFLKNECKNWSLKMTIFKIYRYTCKNRIFKILYFNTEVKIWAFRFSETFF